MLKEKMEIFAGIDTHKETYAISTCDTHGKILCADEFGTDAKSIKDLQNWLVSQGEVVAVGIEGTGCYGKNVTIALQTAGIKIIEVNQGCQKTRRSKGKSDSLDAENAALTARDYLLGGAREFNGSESIDRTSELEDLRTIKTAYDSAIS